MTLIMAYQSQDKITIIADRLLSTRDGVKVGTGCKITPLKDYQIIDDGALDEITKIYAFAGRQILHKQFQEFVSIIKVELFPCQPLNLNRGTLSELITSFYKHLKDDLLMEKEDFMLNGVCIYNSELYLICGSYIAKYINDIVLEGTGTEVAEFIFKNELSKGQTIKEALTEAMKQTIKHNLFVGGGYDILEYDITTKQHTLTYYPYE